MITTYPSITMIYSLIIPYKHRKKKRSILRFSLTAGDRDRTFSSLVKPQRKGLRRPRLPFVPNLYHFCRIKCLYKISHKCAYTIAILDHFDSNTVFFLTILRTLEAHLTMSSLFTNPLSRASVRAFI